MFYRLFQRPVAHLASALSLLTLPILLMATFADKGLAQTTLRIMAANTSSGNRQSYDPGEGTRIFQGLDPDIVLIQEFNIGDNSDSAIRNWIDTTFGDEFVYYRESDAQIPNGVISRYPILDAGEWDDPEVSNRDFAWAQIDIPGDNDLWAISVHLLTRNSTVRNAEAIALLEFIQAQVPEEDYLVIGGDFNTRSAREDALRTLAAVVNTSPPYPVDQDGDGDTNASRRRPYDWVFEDADLNQYKIPVQIGANTFPDGLVFDSRTYHPLYEVAPVRRNDSGAVNMQHMAVIKDFSIPDGDDIAVTHLSSCQSVTGSVGQGQWRHYSIDVPTGAAQLDVQLEANGADGDVDLYIQKATQPTLTRYDFRPWLNGSDETASVNSRSRPGLSGGRWYIGAHGHTEGDYKLTAAIDNCSN
ncbi:MAG: pre-peptidase C-terminal domain-containing protein [Pseudanabaenales cyanobacterium]|nr:pre-peptidase C-terminal domain-containing protein [Pseudanabaenales cyanobacterium]